MRRELLLWIAPWMAFGLGACAHAQQPATTSATATAKACAEWRWIGIKSQPGDTCPAIAGWETKPLFDALAAERIKANPYAKERGFTAAVPSEKVVQELKSFCVYRRKSGTTSPPAASDRLVRIDRDCAAIAVAGDGAQVTDWEQYSRHFLKQAGKPEEPLAIKNREGVRLAFLDTQPTHEGFPMERPTGKKSSQHGYTMAHIARSLVCSEDGKLCAAKITTRLALPMTEFNPKSEGRTRFDRAQGGRIGLQSDLADAIRAEVDDWALEGKPQRLVLNLSVAWDGDLFSGLDEQQVAQMRAGTQAVYWALRYATGFDALVVAAAGNKSTCAKVGPLLPAAWEKGGSVNGLAAGAQEAPLVYAVGGVDSMGEPLANSRTKAMPMRVAYGASAVVPALPQGKSTAKHTGTSVSTAVVSSVAAAVWDTLPDRSPAQIMELLYKSGDPLPFQNQKNALPPRQADFWFGAGAPNIQGGAPAVRRISLCPALAAACKELGNAGGCPMPKVSCERWTPVPNLTPLTAPMSSCDPWVHTQPPFEPCPVCDPPQG